MAIERISLFARHKHSDNWFYVESGKSSSELELKGLSMPNFRVEDPKIGVHFFVASEIRVVRECFFSGKWLAREVLAFRKLFRS